MKSYPITAISPEAWSEIETFFRFTEIPCLPQGHSGDGFLPATIETTKFGVEITGRMTFLGGRSGYFEHQGILYLSRPRFSSIDSITVKKLENSKLEEAVLEDDFLHIQIG